ncbi:MAG: hypothetical protein RKO66_00115 [Candidatus Contendobacter sp.]|nr:hypothetical protein [Candidatus Contendobacter sp.]MDS4059145.1 hypothetical protein [Candidatus Contendobacter sp.]
MKPPLLPKTSLLGRLGLIVTSIAAVVAGFAIASLLFTILVVAGLAFAGWLWWRLRRLARRAQCAAPTVIEGEFTVVPDYPALEARTAPCSEPPPSPTRGNRRVSRIRR